jgi:hypothetical protein
MGEEDEGVMASIDKVIETIAEIAQHRKNTTASEIDWVVDQLQEHGFDVRKPRKTRHGVLYGVSSERFQICTHNPGSKQVKHATSTIF